MDKLMMNKLDDMELDMVAGGMKKQKGEPMDDDLGRGMKNAVVNGVKAGVKAVENAVDRMLYKVFGPPRRR